MNKGVSAAAELWLIAGEVSVLFGFSKVNGQ